MSCHGAIKAGDALNIRQMKQLLEDLFHTDKPYVCPHGRPIIVRFTPDELAKFIQTDVAMEKIYVTPSLKAKDTLTKEARVWADEIGAAFVPRRGRTMEELQAAYGEDILVYTSRGPQLKRAEGTHFSV